MSIPANPQPPDVSHIQHLDLNRTDLRLDLIYKCGGIDKRTIEKFEKVRSLAHFSPLCRLQSARSENLAINTTLDECPSQPLIIMLIITSGSRRDGKGLLQVRMGSGQTEG